MTQSEAIILIHTPDAMAWVKAWKDTVRERPLVPYDDGAMLAWFANAIMTGWDECRRRLKQEDCDVPS